MYNYKIKDDECTGYKTIFNLMMVHFYIHRKLDTKLYIIFPVWMITSSNPPDINRFRSVTVKTLTNILEL